MEARFIKPYRARPVGSALIWDVSAEVPWQNCIERYDRPDTFFFCDPPYWQTEGYGVEFGEEQYRQLASASKEAKGKVMITLNNHP